MKMTLNIFQYLKRPGSRWAKMFLLSSMVGVLSGMAAAALEYGLHEGVHNVIGRFTHVSGGNVMQFNWGILLLPALGGLACGLFVTWFYPNEHNHGTNQMIAAFHRNGGNLPLTGPVVKASATVGLITCGGSTGPEGPIAAVGAGIGSTMARLLGLSTKDRRLLLVAGCAGGVGAIFRCPLGGALFATTVLYEEPELESEAIVPALVASVISYSTFMAFWGYGQHLIGGATKLVFSTPLELVPYAILGPLCGLLSILLFQCHRIVHERPSKRLNIPRWLAPALGGLIVGGFGCFLPQIMDAQYRFLQNVLDGRVEQGLFSFPDGVTRPWWQWSAIFALIAVVKCIATALTVGTARAGGLLGPSVFIGGAAGAALGAFFEAVYPGTFPNQLRQSLVAVGMAGVLAAGMRTPMAAIVMLMEITGGYGLIVPLMLVCVISYVVGRRWGLNPAQVRSVADSPAHAGDTLVHMLEARRVGDVIQTTWPYLASPSTTLSEMAGRMHPGTRPVYAVTDETNKLVGVVSISDISRSISEPGIGDLVIAADIMTTGLTTLDSKQNLYEVLNTFHHSKHEVLPVVEEDGRFVGMLPRQSIYDTVRAGGEEMKAHLYREHAGVVAFEQDEQLHQLLLGVTSTAGDTIQRIAVPAEAVGRTIREADFRRRHGAQVIAIQSDDGRLQCPPDIDAPLLSSQRLLVIHNRAEDAATTLSPV